MKRHSSSNEVEAAAAEASLDSTMTPRESVLEAEMACLGSMIIQQGRIPHVMGILPGRQMWSVPHHRDIADAIYGLHRSGKAVDLVTLKVALAEAGALSRIGGEDYLIQIAELVPSAARATHYAAQIREAWASRNVAQRARDVVNAYAAGTGWDKLSALASGVLAGRLMPDQCSYALEDLLGDDVSDVEEAAGIATGFRAIDNQTSLHGLPAAQMTVLGAPTKTGKSFLAQQIAVKVAKRGERVIYMCFGGDLDERSLRARWIKQTCGILPVRGIEHDVDAVNSARALLRPLPITVYVAERAGDRSIEAALDWAEAEYRQDQFSLIIVDYAQVAKTREPARSGVEQVENVSRAISSAIKRMPAAAALVLSQMAADDSDDYRYSQQLVNDCGLGMILRKDGYPVTGQGGYHNATLTVKANRWGYSDSKLVGKWWPTYTTFEWGVK